VRAKQVLLTTLVPLLLAQAPAPNLWQQIQESTDSVWLEKVVLITEDSPLVPRRKMAKAFRSQAYARLGALGTAESLAAVDRIEATARTWRPNEGPLAAGVLPHPGWHMSNGYVRTDVRTKMDGVTYAVFIDFLFGDMDLLLISSSNPDDNRAWSRPHLVPVKVYRGMHNLMLSPGIKPGLLILSFVQDPPPPRAIMEGTQDRGQTAPKLGAQTAGIDVNAVLRDSDRDGLTDIEEARLGLRPDKADTDGDGIRDGDDSAPDYAPPAGAASDENVIVLQKAFFATFGISGSRYTMFAREEARWIQPWGFRGQVLYHAWHPLGTLGAVEVSWKIREKSATSATVELFDSEGPLAAGGVDVKLEKKNGTWYVVSVQTTWIS
jgi:hypothetical protein